MKSGKTKGLITGQLPNQSEQYPCLRQNAFTLPPCSTRPFKLQLICLYRFKTRVSTLTPLPSPLTLSPSDHCAVKPC